MLWYPHLMVSPPGIAIKATLGQLYIHTAPLDGSGAVISSVPCVDRHANYVLKWWMITSLALQDQEHPDCENHVRTL